MSLYNSQNIDSLDWPDTIDGQYAKKYIAPLVKNGIHQYVSNLQTEIFALKIDDFVLPVIVASEGEQNSYICSPYDHYISYGKESLGLIDNRLIAMGVKKVLSGLGKFARAGKMNSVVYVNHWLFSLDLYPKGFSEDHVAAIVPYLKKLYPDHAIIFRSTNPMTSQTLQKALKHLGFHLIPSRYVHVTDATNEAIFKTRIIKSDLKLWNETPYQILDETQLSSTDCQELLKLYNTLYIEQHSERNPKYTLEFIKHLVENRLLHFRVLKQEGSFKGVAGFYERNGVMMCPFFGYNKKDPQHTVIYRLLSTSLLLEARKRGVLFHQSAGASFYKSIRRAQGCFETMAVYTAHLQRKQRMVWSIFNFFLNSFAPKYMQKY